MEHPLPLPVASQRVHHMKGGMGETSYTNNSLLQKKVIMNVKPILDESVKRMMSLTTSENCWRVADLGCSSGPNALMVVSNILNIIDKTTLNLDDGPPVLQVYLNDLIGNDFNTLFQLLPDFYKSIQQERGNKVACYINATPGNFYGRLFPNNYIHFFHSSYSLHWQSQAPKDLTKTKVPINKGNIYMTSTTPPSVHEAYFEQFKRDFKLFLKSRSEELMPGGVMILTFIGRDKANETHPCTVLSMALSDIVEEGLLKVEKLDFFDLPIYSPTIEEVKQVLEVEGSFTLETLKTIKMGWDAKLQEDVNDFVLDNEMRGQFIAKSIRAVFEPLLLNKFGKDIMDQLFSRFAKLVSQLIELETLKYTSIVMSMTKDPRKIT